MNALLLVSLGPVQEFIAAGRRTADLWAGSALLSHLAGKAVEAVEAETGPDAFLFPARGAEGDADAALPNRFLVRVPDGRAEPLARAAEAAVRSEMHRVAAFALGTLGLRASHADDADRAAAFVEIAWAAAPLTDALDGLLTDWPTHDRTARSYRLVEMLAGGRKALRDFGGAAPTETSAAWPSGEAGVRCTLMPTLPALVERPGRTPAQVGTWWQALAGRSGGRVREGERLSAVALAKRFFTEYLRGNAGAGDAAEAFPSTSSFATADFWAAIHRSDSDALRRAVRQFDDAVRELPDLRWRYTEAAVPAVERAARDAGRSDPERHLSGRLVIGDPLDPEAVRRETGLAVGPGDLRALNEARADLLRAAADAGAPAPSRYYGVLVLDGDKMGQWLSGARGADAFGGFPGADRHREISRRLRTFASESVPRIVEGEHAGRVVYAGGDDVVALLSFETALPAARAVAAAFQRDFHPTATASAGLVLAHHLTPLQQVLAAARAAEKRAKGAGRDRLALTALKRSGDPAEVVLPWDALDGLVDFARQTREGHVAKGFAYDLADALRRFRGPDRRCDDGRVVSPAVPGDLRAPFRAEAERLFRRRTERSTGDERRARFAASAGPLLDALPPSDAVAALAVGQFLGRGGDR